MFPGWDLIGMYDSDVGAWILHHGGEAMLLEIPEGLTVADIRRALGDRRLEYMGVSHSHPDHLDVEVLEKLRRRWPAAVWLGHDDSEIRLGGEPLYRLSAPKHSPDDIVTVFRGVAMTGDIELGTLDSVSDEVPMRRRRRSMQKLRDWRPEYHVHTTVSAHVDDVRRNIDWHSLFNV